MRTSHAAPDGDVAPEEWRLRARCRGMDITVFYLDEDGKNSQLQSERIAKNICRRCPVIRSGAAIGSGSSRCRRRSRGRTRLR
ncbi:MAG: hypothetical protein EOP28_00665 [Rhodococcus sp. (in: high G+C Gram-positive bacteria)]|nr:MAG: hypothetical protein EOP28_00665 [Rhodococcus sp. (in: high G+C Gram-positive bacteria)]